ncbi:protein bicaudal D-like isoform X1 [Penaeus chinensis]|uniref:protein bicaudal D-like isoform X1 n=1 Tax=Penaeus chinensis TaxID=139456 RepID=UPI001FB7B062|nr:protein bicaudal D-like isoform X1 [Penaeus chinensis]
MLALALLSFCAAGWAAAAPRDEDLRASVVFNQLAIAQVLDNLSNISQGDAAVTTQLAQLSQSQKAQMQQTNDGLARVTSSLEILSQALTSHLQQDDVINRGSFMPSEFVERVKAQENEMQQLLQRINQTAAVIQQLEEQSLQLQNEVDLRRHEVQQKEDLTGQLKASIRRVKDENLQILAKGNDAEGGASLQTKAQALKDELAGEKALHTQKQATKTQLEQQVAQLESASSVIRQELAQLDQDIEQLQQRKTSAEGEKKAQLEKNANLREAKEEALAAKTRIQTVTDQLTGRIRSVEAENKVLEQQKKNKEDALGALRASLASLNTQKNEADGRLSDVIGEMDYVCFFS